MGVEYKYIENDDFEELDKMSKELDSRCICEYTDMILKPKHCSKCGRKLK